jgi:hypothetical protein
MNTPKVGEIYQHHKGTKYLIVAVGLDVTSDRDIKVVIYHPVDKPGEYYVRRLHNFVSVVAIAGKVGEPVTRKPRFTLIPGSMK